LSILYPQGVFNRPKKLINAVNREENVKNTQKCKQWRRNLFRLQNYLYCVGWGVKLYSLTHSRRK